jgi:hypothetical protein
LDIGQSTRWKFKGGGKKKEKTTSTLHIQSPADIPFSFLNICVFPKLLIKMASTWPPLLSISYRYRVVKTSREGKDIDVGYPTKRRPVFIFISLHGRLVSGFKNI